MKMIIGLVFLFAFTALNSSALAYSLDSKKDSQTGINMTNDVVNIVLNQVFPFEATFSVKFIERVSVNNDCEMPSQKGFSISFHRLARDGLRCS